MSALSLVFHLHHSHVLRKYSFLDIGKTNDYFDSEQTEEFFRTNVEKSYMPAIELLTRSIRDTGGKFKVSFSISGIALEMMLRDEPILLKELKALSKTGSVEFLCLPYYGSLAWLYSQTEFERQVSLHKAAIKKHFGKEPKIFHNTGLIYDDSLSNKLLTLRFEGVIMEGVYRVLPDGNPNFIFESPCGLPVIARNYGLSDSLTFRDWKTHPFDAKEFVGWVKSAPGQVSTVFVDLDIMGVYHPNESGIFDFLEQLALQDIDFVLPSEALSRFSPVAMAHVPVATSWAGAQKDLSGWLTSHMQVDALQKIYSLEPFIKKNSPELTTWSLLQSANYFQTMNPDSQTHKDSPFETFIYYMNILSDFDEKLRPQQPAEKPKVSVSKAKNSVRLRPRGSKNAQDT